MANDGTDSVRGDWLDVARDLVRRWVVNAVNARPGPKRKHYELTEAERLTALEFAAEIVEARAVMLPLPTGCSDLYHLAREAVRATRELAATEPVIGWVRALLGAKNPREVHEAMASLTEAWSAYQAAARE